MSGERDKKDQGHSSEIQKDHGSRNIGSDRGKYIDNVTDTVKPERPQPAKKEK
jgi:hypothetical protein